jgi:Zn-dependent protease
MRFSDPEKRDLIKAWIVISLAVAIAELGGSTLLGKGGGFLALPLIIRAFVIYALTVGAALVAHEVLGHKLAAQHFDLFAEFCADDVLLVFSLLSSFLGFVFIAPGAVVVAGMTPIDTYGKVAAAGPMVNIALAVLFSILHRLGVSLSIVGVDLVILSYGVNAWFALFNMLPVGLWDGAKVYNWDRKVWLAMTAIAALLFLGVI